MAIQWILLERQGSFQPRRVNDTHTYVGILQQESLTDILGASRTVGYPLFLKAVGLFSTEFTRVPEAHAIVYFGAILLFWLGCSAYVGSQWLGFVFAAPMIFANLFDIVGRVQADFLSCAVAVAALAFLLWSAGGPDRRLPVAALALALFAAYQIRPSYLFLIGFVPALGAVLWFCRHGIDRRGLRWSAAILLASVVPFLAFSALRWATVDHFGVVSYGGVNAIGIAVVLMDGEAVANLPAEVKPLGERIYRKVRMGKDRVRPYPPNLGGAAYRYNRIVWKTSFPMAVAVLEEQKQAAGAQEDDDATAPSLVEVNQLLTDLSVALFRSRPLRYLEWIGTSSLRTTRRVVADRWIRAPAWVLGASVAVVGLGLVVSRLGPRRWSMRANGYLRPAIGAALLGIGFYLCHLFLIVAVEIPLHRYTVSTTPFLSGSLAGLTAALWMSFGPSRSRSKDE